MNMRDMERLTRHGVWTSLDFQFARFMVRLAGSEDESLFLAAALASHSTGKGHVCCDLALEGGKQLATGEAGTPSVVCPALAAWCAALRTSSVVGAPGSYRPLILDDRGRLYLYRYWEYENDLASFIRGRSKGLVAGLDETLMEEGLHRYFPKDPAAGEPDWQRAAAKAAITRKFCVVSGGPGTGKTRTVARILALLLEQAGDGKLRIALAAPTGKAAARLEESIGSAKGEMDAPQVIKDAIPSEASTLHRLLGALSGSPYFRHDARNPLSADVVIVDEASMVDLALMAKLVRAMPPEARLILLGDKDQLASVEAGAVLGDICGPGGAPVEGSSPPDMAQCIVELRVSHRFGGDSGIGFLSRAIQEERGDRALDLLKGDRYQDIQWKELPEQEALARALRPVILKGYSDYLQAVTFEDRLSAFQGFRILCALRQGPYGVVEVNRLVETVLQEAGLIERGQWVVGRPVMITANDYHLKLFNGDIGFVLPDHVMQTPIPARPGGLAEHDAPGAAWSRPDNPKHPSVAVFFPSAEGPPRRFLPARLPAHETVYAMTVHKSQGSEFHEVVLLLADRESPVLTRELLYTGITRARGRVSVWGREDVFRAAASSRVQRHSGLRDALWG